MYGLVNRAIEQLVVSQQGESAWRAVCLRAGLADAGFVSLQIYDDEVTFRLLHAGSQRLNLPLDQVLEALGRFWIRYTSEQGYGSMMSVGGHSLREFLGKLDRVHEQVDTVFPHMSLPQFRVEDVAGGEYRLFYASTRSGLAPMVVGMVKGLAQRFEQRVSVEWIHARTAVDEHDVFLTRQVTD
jgi:hypothetical protein